jgi:chemotaxis signal transduction protein
MRALVPAKLETAWFLADASLIREILGTEVWMPIPGARAEMPGVIAWRGRAIPVADLAAPFGLAKLLPGQPRARTLIVAVEDSIVAVPVDSAREVHAFRPDELRPCNVTTLPYASAEAELFERVLPVIDLSKFVAEILGGAARELGAREGLARHAPLG